MTAALVGGLGYRFAMRFGVLGSLAVWSADGRLARIPEAKVRALLAVLLVHEGRPVSADRLIDDVWGGRPPGKPGAALRVKVSQLRRALEDAEPGGRDLVEYGPSGYLVRLGADALDALRFQRLLARAHATDDAPSRVALLSEGLGLWRGEALSDFADHHFARPAIARLEEQRLVAVEVLSEARLELGEPLDVGELTDLVARHPFRERLRAVQIRALYRSGRQSDALRSYHDLRRRLRDEQGLDPGADLIALYEAVLRQDPRLAEPPPASRQRRRSNLPAPVSELIGRSDAVADVKAKLRSGRLVTLTGPGGVGKTRLATEVAAQVTDAHPDGVFLVELAGRTPSVTAVAEAISDALGMRDDVAAASEDLVDRLTGALGNARMLLVLDSCEPVVTAAAELTGRLLRAASPLRVLATSREPLGVPGEQVWPVPPLDLPDIAAEPDPAALRECTAVQLFLQRAAAAAPGFVLDGGNAAAVAAICRRLDGIPLALELAATRVRALGVPELADRLDDRFRLLSSGPRGVPARQQTLRATLDWSWNLLTGPERIVLRRLSVHTDGWSLEAAEAVCSGAADEDIAAGQVLDLLTRLVDRSLVAVAEGRAGVVRYRLLESVAAYCAERLQEAGETEHVRERHARYYTELAERATASLRGHQQRTWLHRLDEESANLRAALDTAVRRADAHLALRLVCAAAWYWYLRGRLREGRRAAQAALALDADVPADLRARATVWLAGFTRLAPTDVHPSDLIDDAVRQLAAIDDPAARANAQWFLAFALFNTGEETLAADLLAQAGSTFEARQDHWGTAAAQGLRAWHALTRGDLAVVADAGEQSRRAFGELGDAWGQVQASSPLATLAQVTGDYERAAQLHRAALRLTEDLGLWPDTAWHLAGLGRIAMLTGDYAHSRELHEQAMRIAVTQSDVYGQKHAELGLALVARREGRLDVAERWLRAVLDGIPYAEAGGTALVLAELGYVAELRGDAATALDLQLEGWAAARTSGDPRAIALALEGVAAALALAGRHREAARLLGAADAARRSIGVRPPAAERGDVDRTSAAVREALGDEDFAAEWESGAGSVAGGTRPP